MERTMNAAMMLRNRRKGKNNSNNKEQEQQQDNEQEPTKKEHHHHHHHSLRGVIPYTISKHSHHSSSSGGNNKNNNNSNSNSNSNKNNSASTNNEGGGGLGVIKKGSLIKKRSSSSGENESGGEVVVDTSTGAGGAGAASAGVVVDRPPSIISTTASGSSIVLVHHNHHHIANAKGGVGGVVSGFVSDSHLLNDECSEITGTIDYDPLPPPPSTMMMTTGTRSERYLGGGVKRCVTTGGIINEEDNNDDNGGGYHQTNRGRSNSTGRLVMMKGDSFDQYGSWVQDLAAAGAGGVTTTTESEHNKEIDGQNVIIERRKKTKKENNDNEDEGGEKKHSTTTHTFSSSSKIINASKGEEEGRDKDKVEVPLSSAAEAAGPRKAMTASSVLKDEKRIRKFLVRCWYGWLMMISFLFILYSGHVYICGLVALCQLLLFRELVKVRYNTYFHIIEQNIPLFRTTQWMWFLVAIFYTYSDFAVEIIQSNTQLHYLMQIAQLQGSVSFVLYSGTFVLTISTMQIGYIRFQLNQLCWTIVVLCLTVGQLKYIMHNVYNGLFWFALPALLVVFNDSFAYISGLTCGRKFIRRPFINLSPNKTWEGFIGGWIFTMIISWHLSKIMAKYTWMVCPTNEISFFPDKLDCEFDPVFHEAQSIYPTQIFELLPTFVVKMIPNVVEICAVKSASSSSFNEQSSLILTNCISGDPTHSHHHFELIVKGVLPIQLHALSLGMFASLVSPFGGFLASGIKRAYGVKDFDSIIPGHGGIMDRMDCQFLMALCTWVHYNTFVKITTVSVPKMLYMYNLMKDVEQEEFLKRIMELSSSSKS